ncbi:MAG: DNA adenine methylase [Phycisphaerales bacterium]
MIKYLGSKRTLIPTILDALRRAEAGPGGAGHVIQSVVDLFSGTSRVGHALKAAGYRVLSNDHNAYAATLARCYVQADREDWLDDAAKLVREFNMLPGAPGYFTSTFCERSRYLQPRNGERVDAIREAIARKSLPPELEAVMLTSLMEAADRVDSTTGVQMAYLKSWAPRSFNRLELRVPDLLPRAFAGKGEAHMLDALAGASSLRADAAYIDPPYNQHSYLGNYHVWESLVRWDKPEVYGVACKRVDVRERASALNSRRRFPDMFREVLRRVRAPILIVSFSNEGFLTRADMESMLAEVGGAAGSVEVIEREYRRYVGAQIGIYNPRGHKVGTVSHLTNTEFVYVVRRGTSVRAQSGAAGARRRRGRVTPRPAPAESPPPGASAGRASNDPARRRRSPLRSAE